VLDNRQAESAPKDSNSQQEETRDKIIESISCMPHISIEAAGILQILEKPNDEQHTSVNDVSRSSGFTQTGDHLAKWMSRHDGDSLASLKGAILKMSMQGIVHAVASWSSIPLAQKSVQCHDMTFVELMKHSLMVRVGVAKLAEVWQLNVPHYTYTAALLHDVGKLVLGTLPGVDPALIEKTAKKNKTTIVDAERMVLGADHSEIGAMLLHGWNMPECVVETVRCHHFPGVYPGESVAAHILYLADVTSLMCEEKWKKRVTAQDSELIHSSLSHLGIEKNPAMKRMTELSKELANIEALFPDETRETKQRLRRRTVWPLSPKTLNPFVKQ